MGGGETEVTATPTRASDTVLSCEYPASCPSVLPTQLPLLFRIKYNINNSKQPVSINNVISHIYSFAKGEIFFLRIIVHLLICWESIKSHSPEPLHEICLCCGHKADCAPGTDEEHVTTEKPGQAVHSHGWELGNVDKDTQLTRT